METVILKHYYQVKQLMIGKKKINQIKSLAQKKIRQREQLFLIEGDKMVAEGLNSRLGIKELIATGSFLSTYKHQLQQVEQITETGTAEIKKASLLKNPQNSLAICHLPAEEPLPEKLTGMSFYLDGIQDPGNLGTLLRICDWFGMEYLFCSPDTADVYNPKVIQASMGSFARIKTIYIPFDELFSLASRSAVSLFGTFMEGTSLYCTAFPPDSLIVLGNEGNGIRQAVVAKTNYRINIPSFKSGDTGAESLNVAIAAGIIASEFRRQLPVPVYSK